MALRNPLIIENPLPPVFQGAYPENIYEITVRKITPVKNTDVVNVEIYLNVYPDTKKSFQFGHKPIYYILRGLPDDDKKLLKSLYWKELQKQHPDEILDGTPLKDFLIVDK